MPSVLVAGTIHPAGLHLLGASKGISVTYIEAVSTESYAPHVEGADAILIRTQPMPKSIIERAGSLRIVSRHGVGYDAVDVEALSARGIPLAIVGDINSRTVAEHAMTLMLASAKRLIKLDQAVRGGDWRYRDAREAIELDGKSLLIIGFGRIGRIVAGMAKAFGMSILAHDPFLSAAAISEAGAEPAPDLMDALARADFVTIHAPKKDGRPVIGIAEISVMKRSAIIINTSRGGVADEAALLAAIETGAIAGAALDVFESEPPRQCNPLHGHPNILLTPHVAGLTAECAERMSLVAAQNILDCFDGRLKPSLVVNAKEIGMLGGAS